MKRLFISLITLAIFFVSCEDSTSPEGNVPEVEVPGNQEGTKEEEEEKEVPNERTDIVLTSYQKAMAAAGNVFAFDMFGQLLSSEEDNDVFFSPLSVELALGMLNEGARGATAKEIMQTLSFGDSDRAAVNEYYKSLIDQSVAVDNQVDLLVTNALVASDEYDVLDSYVSAIDEWYYAEDFILDYNKVNPVDFVNNWVDEHTKGMIPKLVSEVGDVNIINSIYFNALWEEPFVKEHTSKMAFTDEAGKVAEVDMMRYTSSCRYLSGDVFDMICRSYSNGAYRFSLLLPKDGYGVEDVAEALKENGFQKYMNAAKSEYVKLYMPRFETEYSVNLSETLMAMGMKSAFTANADLSGITTADDLFVDKVLHKASIKLDEAGTCAAAATIVHMEGAAPGMKEPIEFKADRPFVYVITEISSTKVFFIGTYSGPKE